MNITHPELVEKLCKSGEQVLAEMTPGNYAALHTVCQHAVEVGGILDAAKKQAIYQKPQDLVRHLASIKPIPETLSAHQCHMWHMALGIVGEAAELLEAVLKYIETNDLDYENAVEELGDLEFYQEGFRQGLDLPREEVLDGNISKLSKRYEGLTYSDTAAQQRADKA